MIVAITGSSGLVGSLLQRRLKESGHEVRRVVRGTPRTGSDIVWDPKANSIDREALERAEAVIHLAGENIAAGRWSAARKREIRDSRVVGTRLLAETLAKLPGGPRTLLCASATGFYGHRQDEELDESSPAGSGFLAELCQAWEGAADPARAAGLRVAHLRTGIVLSRDGGALAKMLTPFRLGLGGNMGNGRQWWSWIDIEDLVAIYQRALGNAELSGPINCVAPQPLTNADFTRELGMALHRPTSLPLPAGIARLLLGEMADALLLSSARVLPRRLQQNDYRFQSATLNQALQRIFGDHTR